MSKVITPHDPEIAEVLNELMARADAIDEAKKLGETSFKEWLCLQIEEIAAILGYVIQGLSELIKDMGYSFHKGFQEGRNRARANSIRNRDRG